jgi:mono/diheme cytochrome c family protein
MVWTKHLTAGQPARKITMEKRGENYSKTRNFINGLSDIFPALEAFGNAVKASAYSRQGQSAAALALLDQRTEDALRDLMEVLHRHFDLDAKKLDVNNPDSIFRHPKHAKMRSGQMSAVNMRGANPETADAVGLMFDLASGGTITRNSSDDIDAGLELAAIPAHGKALTMDEFCAVCHGQDDATVAGLLKMYNVSRHKYEAYLPTWRANAPARAKARITGIPASKWLSLSAINAETQSAMDGMMKMASAGRSSEATGDPTTDAMASMRELANSR